MGNSAKRVTLLSGFLGSGKTTLLNAILASKPETKFAIIENEIGETSIDSELVIKNEESFTELSNGCICCSINGNFTDTLRELSKRDDWDELIIEATGVADPGGILAPFKDLPWLSKYFEYPHVICLVDAQNLEEQLASTETTGAQIGYADKVYISKTDLVTLDKTDEIIQLVRRLNPFSKACIKNEFGIPIKELLDKPIQSKPIINIGSPTPTSQQTMAHDYFDSVSLEYEGSFNENKLFQRFYTYLMTQSKDLYRFKGIYWDKDKNNKMIIQSVMKSLHFDEGETWSKEEPKTSKFVFIGKNLQEKGFDRLLKSCMT